MAFTQFDMTNPVTTEPVESETYDKWWIIDFRVRGKPAPSGRTKLNVKFYPAKVEEVPVLDAEGHPMTDANGAAITQEVTVLQPNGKVRQLIVQDLFAAANSSPQVAQTMEMVFQVIKGIATQQNIL